MKSYANALVVMFVLFVVVCYALITGRIDLLTSTVGLMVPATLWTLWTIHYNKDNKYVTSTITVTRDIEECEVPEFILAQMRRNQAIADARAVQEVVLPPAPPHTPPTVL